ncbi:MAG TPA: hypothetical protein VNS32_25490, partial [Flavisolibacter sp.]|nr:hypothetical protein [Flavisolibacter sp.]
GIIWERDGLYEYYQHGPLSRMVLGQQQVQGMDYAYTLQGWLKGVNSTALDPSFDMGRDGNPTSTNSQVAKDVLGFALHYYDDGTYQDYKAIGGVSAFARADLNAPYNFASTSLYNGNISAISMNNGGLSKGPSSTTNSDALFYSYGYDQLNRIVSMQAYNGFDKSTNGWHANFIPDYGEAVTYDPNGNILTYQRNGAHSLGLADIMDDLTYEYIVEPNQKQTNRLKIVKDKALDGDYSTDIDDQTKDPFTGAMVTENYTYDENGNMTSDNLEGISNITWTVYGKIESITKKNKTTNLVETISYTYDAAGNRITKTAGGKITVYVRDADGKIMSIYEKPTGGAMVQSEINLYGSSRLGIVGMKSVQRTVATVATGFDPAIQETFTRGEKTYELSNHLGNVLVTISDQKVQQPATGNIAVDYYTASVLSAHDYYPFGMLMPGRTGHTTVDATTGTSGWSDGWSTPATLDVSDRNNNIPLEYKASTQIEFTEGFESGENDEFTASIIDAAGSGGSGSGSGTGSTSGSLGVYRYGFNGKENDDEVKGEGNQQDYGMRVYDTRLGKFLSVDPLT